MSLQAPSPRSKPARDDFSAMIDTNEARPSEPVRAAANDRPERAANNRRDTSVKTDGQAKATRERNEPTPNDDAASEPSKTEAGKTEPKATDPAVTTATPTMDAATSELVKTADTVATTPAEDVAPLTAAIVPPAPVAVIAVAQTTPLIAPPPATVPPQTSTAPIAKSATGPLAIAAAALAISAATVDASASQPAPQPVAQNGETAALVADPAVAAAIAAANATTKPATSKTATPAAEPTETAAIDGKVDAKTLDTTSTSAAATNGVQPQAAAPHPSAAKAEAATAKDDTAPVETVAAPASHERRATMVQANTADPVTPTFTPVHQTVQPTTSAPAAIPQFSVVASQTAPVPLNALAMQIAATAISGKTSFDIRLDPAELGRIDVRLDVDRNGNVTSHLTVEKPETLAMLKQDAPQLQRALNDAGLQTSDKGLQFSLSDQSGNGQNHQSGTHDSGGRPSRLIVSEDELPPVVMAGRSYGRLLSSSSGVDIRV